MNLKPHNIRIGNIEARTTGKHLVRIGDQPLVTAEIVEWFDGEKPSCYTIAHWEITKEGFDLRFVGNRPFGASVDPIDFMTIAEHMDNKLEQAWQESEKE